jgi:nascent polypeptide-associated complex subunit alpha
MIPGMNSRQAKQMMRKMGIQQQDLDAEQVIIKTKDKEIIINNPQVAKVNMMGQQTYQVVGEAEERSIETKPEINEEDIKTVIDQTGVEEDKAKEVIEKHSGDLAAAIMELKQ